MIQRRSRRAPNQGRVIPGRLRQPPASLVEDPRFPQSSGFLEIAMRGRLLLASPVLWSSTSGIPWCNAGKCMDRISDGGLAGATHGSRWAHSGHRLLRSTPVTLLLQAHSSSSCPHSMRGLATQEDRRQGAGSSSSSDIVYLFQLLNNAKATPLRICCSQRCEGHVLTLRYPEVYHQLQPSWSVRQLAHHQRRTSFPCFGIAMENITLDQECPITWMFRVTAVKAVNISNCPHLLTAPNDAWGVSQAWPQGRNCCRICIAHTQEGYCSAVTFPCPWRRSANDPEGGAGGH